MGHVGTYWKVPVIARCRDGVEMSLKERVMSDTATEEDRQFIHTLGFCCFDHLSEYYFEHGSMVDPKIVLPKTCEDVRQQREQECAAIQRATLQTYAAVTPPLHICAAATHSHRTPVPRVKFTRRRLSCPADRVLPLTALQGQALLDAVVRHQCQHTHDVLAR